MKRFLRAVLTLSGLCLVYGCGGGSSAPPPPPPALSLAPTSLSFGVSAVGNESGPQVETLTNTGGSELAINSVAITGTDATDFGQSGTCGSSLGVGASCTLNVTFTPSALGQRSAVIAIADDGVGSPQVLSLNGMGGDSGPNATLSPTGLIFGDQVVGTSSPAQSITLSNYGTTTLSMTGIAASSNFGQTNTCNSTLASGASCTVSVTFIPGSTGSLNGTLSCADSAADSPQTVALSGTGVPSPTCIPQGGACFSRSAHCCPAPRGHHSYCSNPTGWGTCTEN
jgi:trimeric autotransporter adhesin